MADADGKAVNWLKAKDKVDVGNAMPTAHALGFEDAHDPRMVLVYY